MRVVAGSEYRKWGTEMQDDITDATLWAIDQGLAKRGQICICGASYGGYYARSPINFVSKFKIPLHLVHGALDRQAHVDNYHNLCKALDKAGIPYQKLLVKGEAHGFFELNNRIKLYDEMFKFLAIHIGTETR
jgi:dipeptidyl aminopeptidase/acylaminoacyl peptidase